MANGFVFRQLYTFTNLIIISFTCDICRVKTVNKFISSVKCVLTERCHALPAEVETQNLASPEEGMHMFSAYYSLRMLVWAARETQDFALVSQEKINIHL